MILPEYAIPIMATVTGEGDFTRLMSTPLQERGEILESIFDEAKRVIENRRAAYDEREQNFTRIATIWSVVFGHPVTPEQVGLVHDRDEAGS
jgi:hypothetical protein